MCYSYSYILLYYYCIAFFTVNQKGCVREMNKVSLTKNRQYEVYLEKAKVFVYTKCLKEYRNKSSFLTAYIIYLYYHILFCLYLQTFCFRIYAN